MAWGPSFSDLEILVHVVETGSMSAAARALGVEQSTLSRRVERMEREFERRLFVRGRGGAQPTELARRLLPHAEAAMTALAGAQREALHTPGDLSGLVRIALPEGIAEHVVAPGMVDFIANHPGLELELIEASPASDMHLNEADIALRLFKPTQETLVAQRIGHFEHGIYGSRGYCAGKRGRAVEELDWVSFGPHAADLPESRWLARRGIRPAVRVSKFTTLVAAVRGGAGVGLLAHGLATRFPELECLDIPEVPRFATEVWLVATPELRHAPQVAAVWDWLQGLFDGAELRAV